MYQRFSVASPAGHDLPTDVVSYGADVPREDTLKLLGSVDGKRILDLGCGCGHNAIALARQGAKVIGVDESSDQVADARAAADREGVKVELHHAPLAELAFLRADTIDGALSAMGLAPIEDIDRVFRQVHRVLRPEMPLVLSFPHPAFALADPADPGRSVQRSYWEAAPIAADAPGRPADLPRTISSIFTSLGRANFRVDTELRGSACGAAREQGCPRGGSPLGTAKGRLRRVLSRDESHARAASQLGAEPPVRRRNHSSRRR